MGIIALLDSSGTPVVKYKYDAWGNCVVDASTTNTTLANLNPFRYRSYYFDTETNLYFLKTRYYDPEIGRFMTIDDLSYLDPDSINGLNLYAYCLNNPIMECDPTGHGVLSVIVAIWLSGIVVHAATLVGSYIGCAIASIWDADIRADMKRIHWNPFNTNSTFVLDSQKVSFYKGSFVLRHSIQDLTSAGIFGMIVLNRSEKSSDADSYVALNHEWGHNMQELILGTPAYLVLVGIPSAIYCVSGDYLIYTGATRERMYYSKIWERTADVLGGVNRNNYDPFFTGSNFTFW